MAMTNDRQLAIAKVHLTFAKLAKNQQLMNHVQILDVTSDFETINLQVFEDSFEIGRLKYSVSDFWCKKETWEHLS